MNKYRVKLIMSEEYTIEAETPYEAEREARRRWGSDYYIDDVEVSEIMNYKEQ